MHDQLNTGGVWPVVKSADVVRVDFAHRRKIRRTYAGIIDDMQLMVSPQEYRPLAHAGGIPFEVFALAVFLAGVIVAGVGCAMVSGVIDGWSATLYVAGVVVGFMLRLLVEER